MVSQAHYKCDCLYTRSECVAHGSGVGGRSVRNTHVQDADQVGTWLFRVALIDCMLVHKGSERSLCSPLLSYVSSSQKISGCYGDRIISLALFMKKEY